MPAQLFQTLTNHYAHLTSLKASLVAVASGGILFSLLTKSDSVFEWVGGAVPHLAYAPIESATNVPRLAPHPPFPGDGQGSPPVGVGVGVGAPPCGCGACEQAWRNG